MAKKLVIVESPAKSRTLSRILGNDYVIKASMGHVRDLPKSSLGVDIEHDFAPRYVNIALRKKVLAELKEAAKDTSAIYLATDPDREGEAISWHLIEAAKLDTSKIPMHRVAFHEITKEAVEEAFKHPRSIDMHLVDAQQARRVLDRLVGYKLSPLLWKKVQRGLSAGRVQSAAVRIVVDREREIEKFIPTEFWIIEVELAKKPAKSTQSNFKAQFVGLQDGKQINVSSKEKAYELKDELSASKYSVKSINVKELPRQPSPPFITSTMQQEAWRRLHFTAKRTMAIAQQLYEGINIGDEGSTGLITYMRTDSTHIAPSALAETRDFIKTKYGEDYLPVQPRAFGKKGKWAQEAHEAIRPTKIFREPSQISAYLKPEQMKLYELIWKRMVASQMNAALFDITTVEIEAKSTKSTKTYLLKTVNSISKFSGFMVLYSEGKDDEVEDEKTVRIPTLKTGENLSFVDIFLNQQFTQPLARYNEATLIKALEQKGIGRPSTYAPILSTIQDRGYVFKEAGRFRPDDIGFIVNDLLTENFPREVDLSFTAEMEESLDEIARGKKEWVSVIKGFYKPFEEKLKQADALKRIKTDKPTDQVCPKCGKPMVIKTGRFGKFMACTGYPECKTTMPVLVKIGVPCPECGKNDGGELVERVSKKKRRFYGCSRYPECKFTVRQKPVAQPCPQCGKLMVNYRKGQVKCTSCDYKGDLAESEG